MSIREMLAVDHATALRFFYQYLSDEVGPRNEELEQELIYVASILANYCSTSIGGGGVEGGAPLHENLSNIFDNYILSTDNRHDSGLMEIAGAQILLYIGFFRTQQQSRHNVNWFIQTGCSFYGRAGYLSKDEKKKIFLKNFSNRFTYWSEICHKLSKVFQDFADDHLLIKLPPEN